VEYSEIRVTHFRGAANPIFMNATQLLWKWSILSPNNFGGRIGLIDNPFPAAPPKSSKIIGGADRSKLSYCTPTTKTSEPPYEENPEGGQRKLSMARAHKSKNGKAVTLQGSPSSEEEQDEGSPRGHRGSSHLRTAENMLNAVGFIPRIQLFDYVNQAITCI
jgi:hypothetical protein